MALNWNLTLKDGMSGPAKSAAGAGDKLKDTLIGIGGAAGKADGQVSKFKNTLIGLGDAARKVQPTLVSTQKAQDKLGASFAKGTKPAINWGKAMQIAANKMWDDRMARKQPMAIDKTSRSMNQAVPKISAFGKAVQFAGRHFGPKGAQGVMMMGEAIAKYGSTISRIGGMVSGMAGPIAQAVIAVGAIGAGVMAAGAAIGAQVAMHVRGLQAFRESTLFAFTKILGTRQEAQRIFDMASKTSFDLGTDLQTSVSAMNSLLAKGFKADFADELIRRMADLSTLNPSANIDALVYNIGKIRAQGRLQGDELQALSEAGLNVADVYAEIAKSMKLTAKPGQSIEEQVLALQAAGKIKSDIAIPAIMEAIKKASGGGAAGAVASEKASKSPEGMLMRLINLKDQLLSSVQIDWSPITRGIERVMAAMTSPAGAKFIQSIGDGISMIVGKLDRISQADIEAAFEKGAGAVDAFAGAMGSIIDLMIELGPLWAYGADQVIQFFNYIQAGVDMIRSSLAPFYQFAEMLGSLDLSGPANMLGGGIIDGIVAGIQAGLSSVVDAIVGVATSAIAAGKEALGIASPSKVFAKIGSQVSEGMGKGITAGSGAATSATTEMSSAAAKTGANAARAVSNRTSNDNSKVVHVGAINVSGTDNPDGNARAITSRIQALQAA